MPKGSLGVLRNFIELRFMQKGRNRGFHLLPGVPLSHEQGRRRRRCADRWGPSAREREGRGPAAREEGEKRALRWSAGPVGELGRARGEGGRLGFSFSFFYFLFCFLFQNLFQIKF